ncbi:phosphoribosylaminoimidazolesuccinocarboxamide synthase [Prochlorococcus sp. MIT 1223]|uniref:phosphoribosylaminoimidazolesuccinocarboxamide synthase n=1 Tax=Prochlorococcus sp. MIT 1223 TaxID=3096217 RepID=UPI002A754797|nr:phosphoribosylaminoimidazolesuccinocarboxamide synthase [Prochlorococcus sp. MIT 1223]
MEIKHGPLIYEGKAKRVYSTSSQDKVLIEYKDDATAFNALKHSVLSGKGLLNCQISAHLFNFLHQNQVPTHFLSLQGETWMLAQRINVIPLEVVIRNVATGSLCKQTPIPEGEPINPPLLDIYYKDDDLGDPLLTDSRLKLLGLITSEQRLEIESLARKVNELMIGFFNKIDLTLIDFKLEMGFNNLGKILVADEISPDTCRLWDNRSNDSNERILDKDRFRKDLGGVIDGYGEILKRIQGGADKAANAVNLSEG